MTFKESKRGGARPGAGRPRKEDVVPPPPGEMSHREAVRRKEAALAVTREIERDRLAGSLVERVRVEQAAEKLGRLTRDALLGLPVRIAAELAAESDAQRVEMLLTDHLRAVLSDVAKLTVHDLERLNA